MIQIKSIPVGYPANAAQKAGVFSLKDAAIVAQAVEVLTLKEETEDEIS